jgi:hypothetical protein
MAIAAGWDQSVCLAGGAIVSVVAISSPFDKREEIDERKISEAEERRN